MTMLYSNDSDNFDHNKLTHNPTSISQQDRPTFCRNNTTWTIPT